MNFRDGGEGVSGKEFCIFAERRKSIIAEVVLDELIDDWMLCTFGRSSDIINKIGSRGRLSFIS